MHVRKRTWLFCRYEYLKKIIHMPFCLPTLKLNEKRTFVDKMMNSDDPVDKQRKLIGVSMQKVERSCID